MPDASNIDEPPRHRQSDPETPLWYDRPAWYDIVNQKGSAREARELDTIARKHARTRFYRSPAREGAEQPGRAVWLEPACGSGRLLRAGAALGATVIGIDSNPNMVAYARTSLARRGLPGRVIEGRMESFSIRQRVDLAFCPHNSIRHLMDDQGVLSHLECVAKTLKRGGIYVIGLGATRYQDAQETEDVWTARRGGLRVTQVVQYLPGTARTRRERVVSVLNIEKAGGALCREMVYDLRTYSHRQWTELLGRSRMALIGAFDEVGDEMPEAPDATGYRQWVLMRREDAGL